MQEHVIKYSERYDAAYCETCDVWLDTVCDEFDCIFCVDRPTHPNLATDPDNKESIGTKCPKEENIG